MLESSSLKFRGRSMASRPSAPASMHQLIRTLIDILASRVWIRVGIAVVLGDKLVDIECALGERPGCGSERARVPRAAATRAERRRYREHDAPRDCHGPLPLDRVTARNRRAIYHYER